MTKIAYAVLATVLVMPAVGEESATTYKSSDFLNQPLVSHMYTADPSAHVFKGKLYIYPSHDREVDTSTEDDNGGHFDMVDYHVFSLGDPRMKPIDHGVALHVKDVPWASRQMWAPDAAEKDGTYYFYFPAKDHNDIFRIGVATSKSPTGPFTPEPEPIPGSFSIDPAVFQDDDGSYYMYLGGIWGGQLQRWQTGKYIEEDVYPKDDEPAIMPLIAKMSPDMKTFAEPLKEVVLLDAKGDVILAGDNSQRFFEAAWVHKYNDTYYFSYSTGDTHFIQYGTSDSPYGPFKLRGKILEPVLGWTNHHSIAKFKGSWYVFYHDSQISGGQTHLRNIKMTEIRHLPDGSIETVDPFFGDDE